MAKEKAFKAVIRTMALCLSILEQFLKQYSISQMRNGTIIKYHIVKFKCFYLEGTATNVESEKIFLTMIIKEVVIKYKSIDILVLLIIIYIDYICVCVRACVRNLPHEPFCQRRPTGGIKSSRVGVTGNCEMLTVLKEKRNQQLMSSGRAGSVFN